MQIKYFLGGFDKNFCYLIWCSDTNEAAIIDPSVEILPVIEFIESNNLKLRKIIITHTHNDHIAFLDDFLFYYPFITILGHPDILKQLGNNFIGIDHYQNITLGKMMLTAIHTPGHYADSICIWNIESNSLFTGDTIFVGRTGRVISKHSSVKDLYNSIYEIILKLPEHTIIYPGHHYGYTKKITIKENIILSDFFRCKDINEFIKVIDEFEKNRRKKK